MALLVWLLVSVTITACAGRGHERRSSRRAPPPGPVIVQVDVEGVHRFERDAFLEYLNLQPSSRVGLSGKHYFLPGLERIDAQRIVDLYAAHGHFDAKVEKIDVELETRGNKRRHARRIERKHRRGRPPPDPLEQRARVKIVVEEGPATRVRTVEFRWVDQAVGHGSVTFDRTEVESTSVLHKSDVFSTPDLNRSATIMRDALRKRGHARAQVEPRANVHRRERWADVYFTILPAEAQRVGEIRVEGLRYVPRDLVQREIDFVIDKPYSPKLVTRVENAVYGMGVFSAVSVEETPSADDTRLDLVVRVQENKLQSVKFGVGVGVDPQRWEQRVSVRYRHDSIFGRLTRMDVIARVGYAEIPPLRTGEHGPVAGLDLVFRKKGLLERRLVWTENPSVELGIQPGYQFVSPRNRIGVSRFFTRYVEASLAYHNRFVRFFNAEALEGGEADSFLRRDYRNPYFLSYISAATTLHLIDRLLEPRNGAQLRLGYDLANTYLGGQYSFHKLYPELRLYLQPHDRIQLAARGGVGVLVPYGRNAGVPIDMKLYLGGANDMRGWPVRHLSPRIRDCDGDGDDETDCKSIPIGGYTQVLANAEFRVRLVSSLWLAVFGDTGDVRDGVADFDASGLQFSTGGGLRYSTPIGTVRGDFGYRIVTDNERFPEARRFGVHLSLGEAF